VTGFIIIPFLPIGTFRAQGGDMLLLVETSSVSMTAFLFKK